MRSQTYQRRVHTTMEKWHTMSLSMLKGHLAYLLQGWQDLTLSKKIHNNAGKASRDSSLFCQRISHMTNLRGILSFSLYLDRVGCGASCDSSDILLEDTGVCGVQQNQAGGSCVGKRAQCLGQSTRGHTTLLTRSARLVRLRGCTASALHWSEQTVDTGQRLRHARTQHPHCCSFAVSSIEQSLLDDYTIEQTL